MNKALLLTWYDGCNYGTILQCYCLKEIIENPSITELNNANCISSIKVNVLNYNITKRENRIKNFLANSFKENVYKLHNKILRYNFKIITKKNKENIKNRELIFDAFKKNNFDFFPEKPITTDKIRNIQDYDYYIIGSDQVWNPNLLNEIFLLDWVNPSKNKFSYAPSLCVNYINKKDLIKYKKLQNFNQLSVREDTPAIKQIETIIDKEIKVVVDPVILYGRKALLKKCRKNEEYNSYIVSYFLGNTSNTRKYFLNFGEKNKIKMKSIININPLHVKNDIPLEKYAEWNIDPIEIINYIYNSKLIITDSFHIMVIATLLHKDFIILGREDSKNQQNNRIINFLKMVGLEEKYNYKAANFQEIHINQDKWKDIDDKIEKERRKSFDYLIKCIR